MASRPDSNNPVRQLIDEHEIFMEALEQMGLALQKIDDEAVVIPEDVLTSIEQAWIAINEHLNIHFVKEEEIFFPYIERLIPGSRVKFQFLHVDHDKLREAFEAFTLSLQDYRAGRTNRWRAREMKRITAEMVHWFYYHIVAEDTIYLQIAEQEMAPEESREVLQRMQALEARLKEELPGA